MIHRFLLTLAAGFGLLAQGAELPDLKAVLELSDAQVQGLGQLQQQKAQAIQPIAQRMEENRQLLEKLVQNPNSDPATAGRLILEIAALGRQAQQIVNRFQQLAVNLLQPAQRSKLETLSQVLQLELAARQAAALGLVNAPSGANSAGGLGDGVSQ